MTSTFSQKAFGRNYAIEKVWMTFYTMTFLCIHNFYQFEDPMRLNKRVEGTKLPFPDKVLQKLSYYQTLPENQNKKYTLMYEDRFLGLIEASVDAYIENGEIPYHRIRLFKCDGQIIWDRKNKFSIV